MAATLGLQAAPVSTATIPVRLATVVGLPPAVRATLVREVDRIWTRAGVHIEWDEAGATAPRRQDSLRVLVVSQARASNTAGHAWPVAELLRDPAGRAVAVASVESALRVVQVARYGNDPETLIERRLGIVLGRAVAHEIGHALLASGDHARRGLMRASIDAAEFADLRDAGFSLDGDAAGWITSSLAVSAAGTPGPVVAFHYGQ